MSKWAYWADTCDGEPCCGECDECPIKDEAIAHMSDRDCKSCKHNKPDGCSRWDCEYEPVMSDLISRQDAINALGEEPEIWNDTEEEWAYRNAWVEHISAIKSLPSAEPKTGEWVIDDAHTEHCSVCGHTFYTSALFTVGGNDEPNFCPNCGARMYKGGDSE